MKLRSSICAIALAAVAPAFAQEDVSQQSGKPTAAIDLVVNGQIRRVVIALDDQAAPQTVANFEKLARSGFFAGQAVHRVIPNYIIQMGDPYTADDSQKHLWGTGGPDHSVPLEIKNKHVRGSVAMAKQPDGSASSGSQFFIVLADQPQLDGKYTVFANVVRGIEHLDYVATTTVDTNDVPITRVSVNAVSYASAGGEPEANSDAAILAGAANAASVASGAVRNAGQKVVEAVPDKMPKARLPKLSVPFIGRKKEEAVPPPPAPAPEAAPAPGPAPEPAPTPAPTVASTDDRVPPEFDLLEEEIAAVEGNTPPPAPVPAPAPSPEPAPADPAPQVTENPDTGRKLLSLPVPKGKGSKGEKGLMTRVIERVW